MNYFNRLVVAAKTTNKVLKQKFTISPQDIYNIYREQHGKCDVTGEKLALEGKRPNSVVIKRLHAKTGFVANNVVLVARKAVKK